MKAKVSKVNIFDAVYLKDTSASAHVIYSIPNHSNNSLWEY